MKILLWLFTYTKLNFSEHSRFIFIPFYVHLKVHYHSKSEHGRKLNDSYFINK